MAMVCWAARDMEEPAPVPSDRRAALPECDICLGSLPACWQVAVLWALGERLGHQE